MPHLLNSTIICHCCPPPTPPGADLPPTGGGRPPAGANRRRGLRSGGGGACCACCGAAGQRGRRLPATTWLCHSPHRLHPGASLHHCRCVPAFLRSTMNLPAGCGTQSQGQASSVPCCSFALILCVVLTPSSPPARGAIHGAGKLQRRFLQLAPPGADLAAALVESHR